MCGICGYFGMDDKELLRKMRLSIAHRGPDDYGEYLDKGIGLATNRLSIIDIEGGHQPMSNDDGSIWIAFVGEIYNYKSLREELKRNGHKFRTNSDTEVIIRAYEEHKEGCLQKLNGMFAFAIYDQRRGCIFLARDRLGIKPLYYARKGDCLLFASEIKSILKYDEIKKDIDLKSLDLFMSFRYDSGPNTIYSYIKKLMPGEYMIFKEGKPDIKRYWDVKPKEGVKTEEQYAEEMLCLLKDSVKKMLQSDVPLGVFLSGGIDSCLIVSIMKELEAEKIKTFTLGFNEKSDETEKARKIAEQFGTEHHEVMMDSDILKDLPKIFYHADEPQADTTIIPTYHLTRYCKRHATVILTGEGADEVFGGYEQYRIMKAFQMAGSIIPRNVGSALKGRTNHSLISRTFNSVLEKDMAKRYVSLVSIYSEEEKDKLYSKETRKKIRPYSENLVREHFSKVPGNLNKMQYFDLKYELPQLLMKVDKMSMANSVEARVPYLDHRIVELSLSMPEDMRLKGFKEKHMLRKIASKLLPKEVAERKKKRFFTPIDSWMEHGIREYAEDILSDDEAMHHFNRDYIQKIMDYKKNLEYRAILRHNPNSRIYYSRKLWNIIAFGLWHREYIRKG